MTFKRIDQTAWAMSLARVTAQRGTCPRRQVGCVLFDKHWHVLATGYNGAPRGLTHCLDQPCPGASLPSGEGLDLCEATHAESNALIQCRFPEEVAVAAVTTAPCITCVKMLLNTPCQQLLVGDSYPHEAIARDLWTRGERCWVELVE